MKSNLYVKSSLTPTMLSMLSLALTSLFYLYPQHAQAAPNQGTIAGQTTITIPFVVRFTGNYGYILGPNPSEYAGEQNNPGRIDVNVTYPLQIIKQQSGEHKMVLGAGVANTSFPGLTIFGSSGQYGPPYIYPKINACYAQGGVISCNVSCQKDGIGTLQTESRTMNMTAEGAKGGIITITYPAYTCTY